VRLARRIPVRIWIDSVPRAITLTAGLLTINRSFWRSLFDGGLPVLADAVEKVPRDEHANFSKGSWRV
jgi:hypothetical protein